MPECADDSSVMFVINDEVEIPQKSHKLLHEVLICDLPNLSVFLTVYDVDQISER